LASGERYNRKTASLRLAVFITSFPHVKKKIKYGKRITGKEENNPATVVVVAAAAVCIRMEVVLDVLTPRCFSTVWVGVV